MSNIVDNVGEIKTIEKAEFSSLYQENSQQKDNENSPKSTIFGSSLGKYYYYKGCGGDSISQKNLVYYKTEQEAESKGKILYSKCQ